MISSTDRFQQFTGTLSTTSGKEMILVNSSNGRFYSLSETGSLVWTALAQPRPLPAVIDYVLASRSALPPGASGEVAAFVSELHREGLLTVVPGAGQDAAPVASTPVAEREPYASPRLFRGSMRNAANGFNNNADGTASAVS